MNIPILSRNYSMYNTMQNENKTSEEASDLKSSIVSSTNDQSSKLNRSTVSFNNSRLYSSAATHLPNSFSQEFLIDKKHLCLQHKKKFSYTCLTCCQNVCSVCLSNPAQHRSHRFQRYNQKKEDLRNLRVETTAQINFKREKLNKTIASIQYKNSRNSENKKIQNLQIYIKKMMQKNSSNPENQQNKCIQYKKSLSQLNQYYMLVLAQLKNTTKVCLIKNTGQKIQENLRQKMEYIQKLQYKVQKQVCSDFRPDFYHNMFTVCHFTTIRQTTKEKIFQPFQAFFSTWRLKVYPAGYAGAKLDEKHKGIQYMSVYAERLDGILDVSSFIICIEITSRKDPRLRIKKQFQSEFTRNQSWGYDRYTKLSNIYDHGFLGDDDTLFIKFSICPSNYLQANRALNNLIAEKQKKQQQNQRRIQMLKLKLDQKRNHDNPQVFFENKQKQLVIESVTEQQNIKSLEQIKQQAVILPKKIPQLAKSNYYIFPQLSEIPQLPIQSEKQSSKINRYCFTSRFKQDLNPGNGISSRSGALDICRNRATTFQNCPSISLEKKSPGKLIRLVSLKNTQLIESSRKKIQNMHNRSSNFF